jgi:hypothetical protein
MKERECKVVSVMMKDKLFSYLILHTSYFPHDGDHGERMKDEL